MNIKDYYFTCLNEEASEISLASCKCIRFGEKGEFSDVSRPNIPDVVKEINDLLAIVELLQEEGVEFDKLFDRTEIENKKRKVKLWNRKAIKNEL
jgi:hypothetical protein